LRIALAGILHDIGTVRLPRGFILRDTQFSAADRAELERRPLYSAECLSNAPELAWLASIVMQVYEREDGSGYPYHIRAPQICEEARVLAAADVFEACIHDRPHRRAMTGNAAFEVLAASGGRFAEQAIHALIRSLTPYPFNEYVVLDTGEIGKVIRNHTDR